MDIKTITNAEYHAHPAISPSGLKILKNQTPAHYWTAYRDPQREHRAPTPAMKIGTAWHAAIFEPTAFEADYIELPDGIDRRSKEGKALFAEIEASGRIPMKPDEIGQIRDMAAAARSHPIARMILEAQGIGEGTIFWHDTATGIECKMRPDWMILPCAQFKNGLIVDGKTTDSAHPDDFGRSLWNLDMAIQAAHYTRGFCAAANTTTPPPFVWLVQERDKPHCTAIYSAGDDLLAYGAKTIDSILPKLAHCIESDNWPGYPAKITPATLPAWAQKEIA